MSTSGAPRAAQVLTRWNAAAIAAILLAACGGGGGGGGGSTPPAPVVTTPMSGTLSAPGGALAFNAPTGPLRLFAEFFGRPAVAGLSGTSPVVGATVKLIQINGNGAQVGADIATTTTTAGGAFTLDVPTPFTPGPSYVIRATGTATLDRLVTDMTGQDVDPASDVTKSLVITQLAGGSIQNLKASQIAEILSRITTAANNLGGIFPNIAVFTSVLKTQVQNDVEISSLVGNATAIYGIAGTVTDSAGAPLANIKIVVRDFSQQVRRAESHTDANGNYSLNINIGDYIVGAINFTTTSAAASEWWTCDDVLAGHACGVAIQNSAAKVSVGAGTATANFKLEAGARVQGSIVANGSNSPLAGVELIVRDFDGNQIAVSKLAETDGSFLINVRPGLYSLSARNQTALPFAGAPYNGPTGGGTTTGGGGAHTNEATPVSLAAGATFNANFALVEGGLVQGTVTDGASPTPHAVPGLTVRFSRTNIPQGDLTGTFLEAVSTDLAGAYRMWVMPGTYAVRARGQTATPTVVGFGANNNPAAVNFGAAMGRATVVLHAPDGSPLSQVKVQVFDTNGNFLGNENTNGDGIAEIYAAIGTSIRIQFLLDNGSTVAGTVIYDGTLTPTQVILLSGTTVAFGAGSDTTPIQLGTLTLPAGGELTGIVRFGTVPTGNVVVQVRTGVAGTARVVTTRTSQDGSYSVSLPAGTYSRVCALFTNVSNPCPNLATPSSPGQFGSADNVTVIAGQSNTADVTIPLPTPMTGTLSVPGGSASGVTMKLTQLTGPGGLGADIATAVTAADGTFTFGIVGPFTAGPTSVVRTSGAPNLDRMVSGLTGQDVNPASTVAKSLVLAQIQSAAANVSVLKTTQVDRIWNRVSNMVFDLIPADAATASAMVSALASEAQNDVETTNSVGNLTAANAMTGTITDSNGIPLSGINVQVRDFKQWIVRAEARTNSSGQYILNIAAGDYVVGALNYTSTSTGGSEWWTCDDVLAGHACGAASMFGAAKVTVTAGTIGANFKLEPGARIQGTIKTNNGLLLPGVQLGVRDFDANMPVIFQDAKSDSSYLVNVRPGDYMLTARNQTAAFFGSATYNGPTTPGGGTTPQNAGASVAQGTRISVGAGDTFNANFQLGIGNMVRGVVTDGTNPVSGQFVRFYVTSATDTNGIFLDGIRTKLNGEYRMWVRFGTWSVRSRGQIAALGVNSFNPAGSTPPVAVDFSQALVRDFTATVGRAQATLFGPGSVPLPQAKVFIFDGTPSTNLQGIEVANGDGSIEVYGIVGNHQLQYVIDYGSTTVGTVHDDGTANPLHILQTDAPVLDFSTGTVTPIQLGAGTGTINLPAGGELKGIVTIAGVPTGNLTVQVRLGGFSGAFRTITTRTSSDGSYSISVPGGPYDRICAMLPGVAGCPTQGSAFLAGQYGSADSVTVTNGQSNTANIAIP